MKDFKKRLEDANIYIGYAVKEGYAEAEDFEGMSDEEKIEWAEYNGAKGDFYANEQEYWGISIGHELTPGNDE